MIKMTREEAIEKILELEFEHIDWSLVEDMLRYGYRGIENFSDVELADTHFNYFDEELEIIPNLTD